MFSSGHHHADNGGKRRLLSQHHIGDQVPVNAAAVAGAGEVSGMVHAPRCIAAMFASFHAW